MTAAAPREDLELTRRGFGWDTFFCSKCFKHTQILHKVDGTKRYLCVKCVVANECSP